jgi:hypothetical protein
MLENMRGQGYDGRLYPSSNAALQQCKWLHPHSAAPPYWPKVHMEEALAQPSQRHFQRVRHCRTAGPGIRTVLNYAPALVWK